MEINNRITIEAKKFLGTPFYHSGRSTLGIDCAGLLYLSYHRAGIDLPKGDGKSYTVGWWKRTTEDRLKNALLKTGFVELSDDQLPDKGDICLFRLYGVKYPVHHNGIMLDSVNFIHAKCGWRSVDKKVGIDSLNSYYSDKGRLDSILRYKDFM